MIHRPQAFIIADTAKGRKQREINGAWKGDKGKNEHIGQHACRAPGIQ